MSVRHGSTGRMQPLHDRLENCSMPVGLIVGTEDTKFTQIAHELGRALPDASIHTIEESGHATHLEQPALTAEAVRHTIGRAS